MSILLASSYGGGGNRRASLTGIVIPDHPYRLIMGYGCGLSTWTNPNDFTSFSFNSVGMNYIGEQDCSSPSAHNIRNQMWYMLNPPIGTYNMTVAYSSGSRDMDTWITACVYTGVKQIAPLTLGKYCGNTSDNTLSSVASVAGGMMMEHFGQMYGDTVLTPQSGQTEVREDYYYYRFGVNLAVAHLETSGVTTSVRYTSNATRYSGHLAACFTAEPTGRNQVIWAT